MFCAVRTVWIKLGGLRHSHPNRVTDHNVEGEVVINPHIGVGFDEGHQGEKTFTAQCRIRGFNAAEKLVHLAREIAFARCFFQDQSTVEPVASFQLVPDDQAAAVLQERPDPCVEITRHPAGSPGECGVAASCHHRVVPPAVAAPSTEPGHSDAVARPSARQPWHGPCR